MNMSLRNSTNELNYPILSPLSLQLPAPIFRGGTILLSFQLLFKCKILP